MEKKTTEEEKKGQNIRHLKEKMETTEIKGERRKVRSKHYIHEHRSLGLKEKKRKKKRRRSSLKMDCRGGAAANQSCLSMRGNVNNSSKVATKSQHQQKSAHRWSKNDKKKLINKAV